MVSSNPLSLGSGKAKLQLIGSWVGNIFKEGPFDSWSEPAGSLHFRSRPELLAKTQLSDSPPKFWWWFTGMWKGINAHEGRGWENSHENAHPSWLVGEETSPGVESNPDFYYRALSYFSSRWLRPHFSLLLAVNGAKPQWCCVLVEIQPLIFCCILQILVNGLESVLETTGENM